MKAELFGVATQRKPPCAEVLFDRMIGHKLRQIFRKQALPFDRNVFYEPT